MKSSVALEQSWPDFSQTERSMLERRSASLWRCSTSSSVRREKTSIRASIVSSRALTRSKRWLMEWWRSRNSRSSRRRHVTSFGREEQVPGLVEPREGIGSRLLDAENNLGIGALLGGMCWAVTERIVIDG